MPTVLRRPPIGSVVSSLSVGQATDGKCAHLTSLPFTLETNLVWPKPTSSARTTGSMHFSKVHQGHSKVVCMRRSFPVEIARFGLGFRHQVALWAHSTATTLRLDPSTNRPSTVEGAPGSHSRAMRLP